MKRTIPIIALLSVMACEDEVLPPDPNEREWTAEFAIDDPISDRLYHSGDTVYMRGEVFNEEGLHGFMLQLTNTSNEQVVYHFVDHVHGNTLDFNHHWIAEVDEPSHMKLTVTVAVDHSGTEEYKDIEFEIRP